MRYRALMSAGGFALMLAVGLTIVLGVGAAAQPAAAQPASVLVPALADSDPGSSLGSSEPISRAVAWLATQQAADGGFGDAGVTADVVIGMAGANLEPRLMRTITGTTPIDSLVQEGSGYAAGGPGEAAKLALAAVAADADPYDLGGLDLIDALWESYSGTLGIFVAGSFSATTTSDQALAMLAVAAVQESVPAAAVSTLASWQLADGSWAWNPSSTFGDPDTTALALMALLASGRAHTAAVVDAVEAAVEYLRSDQLADGGWGWGSASADSTGMVIQALAALGYVPATWTWVTASGGNPQAALQGLQLPGGAFPDWQGAPNVMATAHALPGLAEAPLPVLGRRAMVRRGLSWLAEKQNADGGFGTSAGSSPGGTAEVVFAFAAAGIDVNTVQSARGISPLGFLATQVPTYSHDGGEIGKLILAAVAGDGDPRSFGGYDLVISLTNQISPSGQFNTNSNFKQAMGVLALEAAGEGVPLTPTQWLKGQQMADGGWEWAAASGWGSDPDTTAIALQALIAAGEPVTATTVISAVNYLHALQNDDAGFPSGFDPASNSNSTAYAIQALLAAGEDLMNDDAGQGLVWVRNGRTPVNALRSFQKSDGPLVYQWGGYFGPADNLAATYQAVPALLGRFHPIKTVASGSGSAGPGNQAGLVVDYGDGRYDAVCVTLGESPITGMELLALSGIPFEAEGGLVAGIGGVGCPAGDAWCAPPYSWSYFGQGASGAWQSYEVGAGDSQIVNSSVDGWRWVDWNVWPAPGPVFSPILGNLCASEPYAPVYRGPDPDRLVTGSTIVTATVRAPAEGTVDVRASFGSDLDQDSSAGIEYRPLSGDDWVSVDLVRGDGVFTTQLALANPDDYEFRTTFSDPDGIRAHHRIYLPLALR